MASLPLLLFSISGVLQLCKQKSCIDLEHTKKSLCQEMTEWILISFKVHQIPHGSVIVSAQLPTASLIVFSVEHDTKYCSRGKMAVRTLASQLLVLDLNLIRLWSLIDILKLKKENFYNTKFTESLHCMGKY